MSDIDTLNLNIDWLGGNCPVQAEGTINGKPFYFRARGERWSLGIGVEPVGEPEWEHSEWFGEWPDAGWMSEEQAEACLRTAAVRYASGLNPGSLEDNPERLAKKRDEWAAILDERAKPNE